MKSLMICTAALVVLAAPVAAETRYDRKLERAVMTIVAKKMGGIRGGFSYDAKPEFIVVQDTIVTGSTGIETARLSARAVPAEGLMRAVERRISRIIAF